jgi:hypothetical protein
MQVKNCSVNIACSSDSGTQASLLTSMQGLGSALSSFMKGVKSHSSEATIESKKMLEFEKIAVKTAIDKVSSIIEKDKPQSSKNIDKACKCIQDTFVDLESRLKTTKPEVYSLIAKKFSFYGQELVQEVRKINPDQADDEKGELALEIAGKYEILFNCTCSLLISMDADVKDKIMVQIRELGGSALRFVNSLRVSDTHINSATISKEIAMKIVDLNKSLLENEDIASIAAKMSEDVENSVADLDTNLIFAQAQQLNPISDSDDFLDLKNNLLSLFEDLQISVKNLSGYKKKKRSELAADLQKIAKNSNQMANITVRATACMPAAANAMQISILESAKVILTLAVESLAVFRQEVKVDEEGRCKQLAEISQKTTEQLNAAKELIKSHESASSEIKPADVIEAIKKSLELLNGTEKFSAAVVLPEDFAQLARTITKSVALIVTSPKSKSALNNFKRVVLDFVEGGNASTFGVSVEMKDETKTLITNVAKYCIEMIAAIETFDNEAGNKWKQQLQKYIVNIATAIKGVVDFTAKMTPSENGHHNNQMMDDANRIEQYGRKLLSKNHDAEYETLKSGTIF